MRFLRRPRRTSRSIAVFCGAFHPPTVAHVALANAARSVVDEVVWVMPERFPHKAYKEVPLPERLRMVLESTMDAVGVASESLFFSIAAETEESLPDTEIRLLIGEDGARRILEWDYGFGELENEEYLERNLRRYGILTARRQEEWSLPMRLEKHFAWLEIEAEMRSVSSTEVRQRIASGSDWEELVPEGIHRHVQRQYICSEGDAQEACRPVILASR